MGPKTLHRLMFSLLYPAVLGSVFVSFIGDDFMYGAWHPRLLFGIIFVFHWSIQFVAITAPGKENDYSLSKFVGDIGLIAGMNMAYYGLPSYTAYTAAFQYDWFYLGIAAIGFQFVIREGFDVLTKSKQFRRSSMIVSGALGVGGMALWMTSKIWLPFASDWKIAYLAIWGTLVASLINIFVSKGNAFRKEVSR